MSAKNESGSIGSMIKLGLILAVYAVVSCTLLAVVNNITAPVIEENNIRKANAGMAAVFEQADNFEQIKDFDLPEGVEKLLAAQKDGKVIGAVVQVTGATYDKATIVIGLDLEGTVTGLKFLSLTDSPGFGLKANDPTYTVKSGKTFYEQFTGLKAADGFKVNETFDAVSGATITSNGVAALATTGCSVAQKYLESLR